MDQNLRQWASTFTHLSCCNLVSHLYFSLHCLCCSDHPVAFVRLNLGSLRSDHHSLTDLLLIFDCLGFYPLVLVFARHYYPFYLLVLLLSLDLHLVGPVLGRMCLTPPHPLLLVLLLPLALHPVYLVPLRMCPVPLHPVYPLPVFLLLFPGLSLVSLVLDQRCPAPRSFLGPAVAAQALHP